MKAKNFLTPAATLTRPVNCTTVCGKKKPSTLYLRRPPLRQPQLQRGGRGRHILPGQGDGGEEGGRQHGDGHHGGAEEGVRQVRPQPVEGGHLEGQLEHPGDGAVGGGGEALAKDLAVLGQELGRLVDLQKINTK